MFQLRIEMGKLNIFSFKKLSELSTVTPATLSRMNQLAVKWKETLIYFATFDKIVSALHEADKTNRHIDEISKLLKIQK